MIKKAELLKMEHQVQRNWIKNQIAKSHSGGDKSFLNIKSAERAYKKLESESLIVDDEDIEHFISVNLSEIGIKKLITTLRVYLKRNQDQYERLQVEVSKINNLKLTNFAEKMKITKIEIINRLIEQTNFDEFEWEQKDK